MNPTMTTNKNTITYTTRIALVQPSYKAMQYKMVETKMDTQRNSIAIEIDVYTDNAVYINNSDSEIVEDNCVFYISTVYRTLKK